MDWEKIDSDNIFDLTNVDDLPDKLRESIIRKKRVCHKPFDKKECYKVFKIISMKEDVNLNEMLIAYYRIYKRAKNKNSLANNVYLLKKSGKIISKRKGVYSLSPELLGNKY